MSTVSELMAGAISSSQNGLKVWGGIIINVKDSPFNAKGDGIKDDTEAIQKAIDYAISIGKHEVTFPAGSYKYGTLINIDGIMFIGDGVTLDGVTKIKLTSMGDLKKDLFERGVNVKSFGAVGNGIANDTASIQEAIDFVASFNGKVVIPDGTYILTSTLLLPSNITIEGSSTYGARFSMRSPVPHFKNKDSGFLTYTKIINLILELGTYAFDVDVTEGVSNLIFDTVLCQLQTSGAMRFNKLLQTSLFTTCTFENCNNGITVEEWTTNHNLFVKCEFINLSGHSISFHDAEVNSFVSCRFENGGIPGNGCLILINAGDVHFEGCYFERIHNNLLLESESRNTTRFDNCHFTGSSDGEGGLEEFEFISDGIVQFGTNTWYRKSDGPDKLFIDGVNEGLGNNNKLYFDNNKNRRNFISNNFEYPTSGAINLIKFTRTNVDGSLSNASMLTGKLIIHYYHLDNGGLDVSYSREYHVKSFAIGVSEIDVSVELVSSIDFDRDTILTVRIKSGATSSVAYLEATFEDIPSALTFSMLQWSFDSLSSSKLVDGHIVVDLP